MNRFVLDANVLMQARREYYHPKYCPGFWEWLRAEHAAGRVFSIEAVRSEIRKGNDNLLELLPARFFLPQPPELARAWTRLSEWVESLPCTRARKNQFLQAADYELVAHAMASHDIIVTHEKLAATDQGKIKIPNACLALGPASTGLWDLLRRTNARFVLGQ